MGMFTDLAIGLGSKLVGGFIESEGQKDLAESREEGAEKQANIERLNREFQKEQFEKQIERQQPFLDVGNLALPQLIEAISNRGDVSGLPGTEIQTGLISDFLQNSPEFIKDRALGDLEAVELEKNKGRLSDLVNIGLGGIGSEASSRENLGSTLSQSNLNIGNIEADAVQQSAIDRQNRQNTIIGGLSGIPSLINTAVPDLKSFFSQQQPLLPGSFNPGTGTAGR